MLDCVEVIRRQRSVLSVECQRRVEESQQKKNIFAHLDVRRARMQRMNSTKFLLQCEESKSFRQENSLQQKKRLQEGSQHAAETRTGTVIMTVTTKGTVVRTFSAFIPAIHAGKSSTLLCNLFCAGEFPSAQKSYKGKSDD